LDFAAWQRARIAGTQALGQPASAG
jgi:hypothetical protein